MKSNERRKNPRLFHATKAVVDVPGGESEQCNTIDLSASGVSLDLGQKLEVGQILTVRFNAESENPCVVQGEVKRSKSAFGGRRFETALAFQSLQPRLFTRARAQEDL